MPIKRPAIVTGAHIDFLDDIRKKRSHVLIATAISWLEITFNLSPQDTRLIFSYWMKTFVGMA